MKANTVRATKAPVIGWRGMPVRPPLHIVKNVNTVTGQTQITTETSINLASTQQGLVQIQDYQTTSIPNNSQGSLDQMKDLTATDLFAVAILSTLNQESTMTMTATILPEAIEANLPLATYFTTIEMPIALSTDPKNVLLPQDLILETSIYSEGVLMPQDQLITELIPGSTIILPEQIQIQITAENTNLPEILIIPFSFETSTTPMISIAQTEIICIKYTLPSTVGPSLNAPTLTPISITQSIQPADSSISLTQPFQTSPTMDKVNPVIDETSLAYSAGLDLICATFPKTMELPEQATNTPLILASGNYIFELESAITEKDIPALSSITINLFDGSDLIPFEAKLCAFSQVLKEADIPTLDFVAETMAESQPTTITEKTWVVYAGYIIGLIIRIIHTTKKEEQNASVRVLIKSITEFNTTFFNLLTNYLNNAPSIQNKKQALKLSQLIRLIKQMVARLISNPVITRMATNKKPNEVRQLIKTIADKILGSLLISNDQLISQMSMLALNMLIDQIVLEVMKELNLIGSNQTEDNNIAILTMQKLQQQIQTSSQEQAINDITDALKLIGSLKIDPSFYNPFLLIAIYTGLLPKDNKADPSENTATNKENTPLVAKVAHSQNNNTLRENNRPGMLQTTAELLLNGVILRELEEKEIDRNNIMAVVMALKQKDDIWNYLTECIISGQHDKVTDFAVRLVRKAKEIAKIKPTPGSALQLIRDPYSPRILKLALNEVSP